MLYSALQNHQILRPMITKPFEKWLFEEVEIEFGLERNNQLPILLEWLHISKEIALPESLEKLRISLLDNVEIWNEDELKMLFLAPFLLHFEFYNMPHYRVFTQRMCSLKTETVEASGRVEWFVATGKQIPRNPFFFMQEYKPEKHSGNDPLGQLLMAMVYAQTQNKDSERELYGFYTLGRLCFFVVLQGKNYAVSRAYDATQKDDLTAMVTILERVKKFIHKILQL